MMQIRVGDVYRWERSLPTKIGIVSERDKEVARGRIAGVIFKEPR